MLWQRNNHHFCVIQVQNNNWIFKENGKTWFNSKPIYFSRCLQYMSTYSSCLLQGYGVLAGEPTKIKARLISSHFVIVEWNPPKLLPETVTRLGLFLFWRENFVVFLLSSVTFAFLIISYNLHLRKMNTDETYTVIEKEHAPIIIEDLDANTFYEAFVVAGKKKIFLYVMYSCQYWNYFFNFS